MLLASAIFMLPACQQAETHSHAPEINVDSVKAQIMALEEGYANAMNAKDVDGVMKYYAADAESYGDGEPVRTGADAIRAGIQEDMADDTSGHTVAFTVTGVWAAGNIAVETGTSASTNKDGAVVSTGRYMVLFELRDGKYVAIREMYNDDVKTEAAQ